MPLGILPSGLIGEVSSPAKVLGVLPSGLLGEMPWGSPSALSILDGGMVGELLETAGFAPKDWLASTATASSVFVALPPSAAVGDYCVIGMVSSFGVVTTPSGWDGQYNVSDGPRYAVFCKMLVTSDITAGGVTVTLSGNSGIRALALVWEAGQIDGVDALATPSTPVSGDQPQTVTPNGLTTTQANDTLLAFYGGAGYGASPVDFSQPIGWDVARTTVGGDVLKGMFAWIGKAELGAATGADSTVYVPSGGAPNITAWAAAVMLALKPYVAPVPAITLTFNLPAGTVGAAYTGSVTATNVNGATGAITITATPLPDGLTAGTIVDNGDGSYTLPITGTPTTAGTTSVAFSATNGTQSASASPSIAVTEASAAPVLVQQVTAPGVSSGSNTATLPSPTTAGNTLLLVCWSTSTSSTFSVPSGFVLQKQVQTPGTGGITKYFTKVADGTESVINASTSAGGRGFALQEWVGSITLSDAKTAYVTGISTSLAVGPTDAPVGTQVPVILTFYTGQSPTSQTWPSGWTKTGPLPTTGFPYYGCAIGVAAATSAAVSITITQAARGTTAVWTSIWISK